MGILLIIAVAYITTTKISEVLAQKEREEQLKIYEQGAQFGYEQAILSLLQQAQTCQPIPVFVGNQSIDFIPVQCLQRAQ